MAENGVFTKRAVCFLDVLGFRKMLSAKPLSEVVAKYDRIITMQSSINRPFRENAEVPSLFPGHSLDRPYCHRYVFSDSIILIADDEDALSCLKLIVHAWRFMQLSLAQRVPIRGAIVFGEMYMDQTKNIYVGQALTCAYDLEKQQNWVGVAVDSSVENAYPELFKEHGQNEVVLPFLFRYQVPMKSGQPVESWILNWRWNLVAQHGTRSLFSSDPETDISEKVGNTLKYAAAVIKTGRIYSRDDSAIPVEMRCCWVGEKEPRFVHGDDL